MGDGTEDDEEHPDRLPSHRRSPLSQAVRGMWRLGDLPGDIRCQPGIGLAQRRLCQVAGGLAAALKSCGGARASSGSGVRNTELAQVGLIISYARNWFTDANLITNQLGADFREVQLVVCSMQCTRTAQINYGYDLSAPIAFSVARLLTLSLNDLDDALHSGLRRLPSRIDLNVPSHEKKDAKRGGARWDAQKKVWYALEGADLPESHQTLEFDDDADEEAEGRGSRWISRLCLTILSISRAKSGIGSAR